MSHTLMGKPVIDGFLSFLAPYINALTPALVSLDYMPGAATEPLYPDNPRADCPFAEVRAYEEVDTAAIPMATGKVVRWVMWVYARRTPTFGQEEFLEYLKPFVEPILGNYSYSEIQAAGADIQEPEAVRIVNEMKHPLWDDPELRVMVGEVVWRATGKQSG